MLALSAAMGFSTLVTPAHCSKTLQGWVRELREVDQEKLSLWGIPPRLLKATDVEVSRHLLCAAVRFWKPAHHVFCFDRTELMLTLQKVRQICGFSKLMGPVVFTRRTGYVAILKQLTGLSAGSCEKRLVSIDGPVPMLCLNYFEEVSKKHATLGDELWL